MNTVSTNGHGPAGALSLLSRAEFLRVAAVVARDLDKMVECGVVQKFCRDNSRKGKYFLKQAIQVRNGEPVARIDWPQQKSGRRRGSRVENPSHNNTPSRKKRP